MNRSIPQPTSDTYSISDLVDQVHLGRVRIPEFQRPLRWQWEDVRRLFDSIIKGYPVGSLLLWKHAAPQAHIRLGAVEREAPALADAMWVVDGQQRLTSLANALCDEGQRDERFAIAYDVENRKIVKPDAQRGEVIPFPVIFDLRRLFQWLQAHPEIVERADTAAAVTKAIREFRIPAYVVEQQDEAILRDIFDRMNNYGKRLSRAEVFAALHPGAGSAGAGAFSRIIEELAEKRGFGTLDDDTVLRVVLARRGPNVAREIRDEFKSNARRSADFPGESQDEAYRGGAAALERAVAFLQDDADVPHVTFLPYRYLLVVLARFFALFPNPAQRNRLLLRRWYWRAALSGPNAFAGSWTEAMRELAFRISPGQETDSVQRLLGPPIRQDCRAPDLHQFRSNQADGRVVLCALWHRRPRSPRTGATYTRSDLAEHLGTDTTPRRAIERFFRTPPKGMQTWAGNWYFCLEDESQAAPADWGLLSSTSLPFDANEPGEFGGASPEALLESQCLSTELLACLTQGDKKAFLEGRKQVLQGIVEDFLRSRAEPEFEDTPPLDSLNMDDDGYDDDVEE